MNNLEICAHHCNKISSECGIAHGILKLSGAAELSRQFMDGVDDPEHITQTRQLLDECPLLRICTTIAQTEQP